MFVEFSGFHSIDHELPDFLNGGDDDDDDDDDASDRRNKKNTLMFALVRWLSPHPDAIVCDSNYSPICPPPFDINHSLWEFTKIDRPRPACSGRHLRSQLHLFPGKDVPTQTESVRAQSLARYDFVTIDSIDRIMNCTFIDNSTSIIMETLTIPF